MQQTTQRRIGRPRDPQVKARDEVIYRLIADGISSRSALAAATGHDRPTVQLSCQRLHKAGRIRKCPGETTWAWAVDDGTPCP